MIAALDFVVRRTIVRPPILKIRENAIAPVL